MNWFNKKEKENKFKDGDIVKHKMGNIKYMVIGKDTSYYCYPDAYKVRSTTMEICIFREFELEKVEE